MDLEGLTEWRATRLDGYRALEAAVDAGFYDRDGAIIEGNYRY